MRISDWSSDVCSSDLKISAMAVSAFSGLRSSWAISRSWAAASRDRRRLFSAVLRPVFIMASVLDLRREMVVPGDYKMVNAILAAAVRSEEHTSELQSLMRISYAVFCLNKKQQH